MTDSSFIQILNYFTVGLFLCSFAYLFLSILVMKRYSQCKNNTVIPGKNDSSWQAVTLLKPVCGLDAEMYENLRSFCQQDYPEYQIIFAVHSEQDPAVDTIKQVISEYPDLDLKLIINPALHGSNHKVSSLINMLDSAKHDILVISDSDMRVENSYLKQIVSGFSDENIGAVTCLYSGASTGKMASTLNAMFINEWFLPSVLISQLIQETKFCLGATMAVKRSILEKAGGFTVLKDHLADDYMLGKIVTDQGYKIHLCPMAVTNIVEEKNLRAMISHELRWARTLRTVEPLSYCFTFITDTTVMSILAAMTLALSTGQLILPLAIVLVTFLTRIILHQSVESALDLKLSGQIRLIPVRDSLSFLIRVMCFMGNSVEWRNHQFSVDQAGHIHDDANGSSEETQNGNQVVNNLATNQEC